MFHYKPGQCVAHELLCTRVKSRPGEYKHCAEQILLFVARGTSPSADTEAVETSEEG
jgi:hypothetical protein